MEINHRKTSSVLDLGKVDIQELCNKVKLLNDSDWDTEEDYETNYNKGRGALNTTQHIILRFSNKQRDPFEYYETSRWKKWKSILEPVLSQSTKKYGYSNGFFPRVMLAKLPAKSFITPHTDGTANGSIPHKVHIPIQTNEHSFFYVEDERFHLKQGQAYEVNNAAKHSVVNNGNSDRIHLIYEYLDYDIQSIEIKNQMDKQS